MSDVAEDGAGTPPAGVSAGGKALQPKAPGLTSEQREELVAAYRAARANGKVLPHNWFGARAAQYGVKYHVIYTAIGAAKREIDKIENEAGKARAALRTPEPRAERLKVRRMHGTYGGG